MRVRKLVCTNCSRIFSEDEADVRSERVGEFWGSPAYMEYNACPECGSMDVEEYEESEEDNEEVCED